MLPHIGAGASQAIEVGVTGVSIAPNHLSTISQDTYILGRLLADLSVTVDNVHEALKVYEEIRRPISHEAFDRSFKMCRMGLTFPDHLQDGVIIDQLKANDKEAYSKVGKAMEDIWKFHFIRTPMEDWTDAKIL